LESFSFVIVWVKKK
jgi:hypothetical protein